MLMAAVSVLAAAAWLWINFCRFPASCWNDLRLAPVFMAGHGVPVYTLPGSGVITTWMYGPVPLWVWSPAIAGATATAALLIAGSWNLILTVLAIAAVCARWPVPGATPAVRWLAFAATIAAWPDPAFRFLQADNIVVAAGLVGNLLLITGGAEPSRRRHWLIAGLTACALGAKQNALGLLAAQLTWLWLEGGRRRALGHLGRTALLAAGLGGVAALQFGWHPLWFGAVEIASGLPMVDDLPHRLIEFAPVLAIQWGVPLGAFAILRHRGLGAGHPLQLPMLAWWWSLPLGALSMLTTGGSTNNLHGFQFLIAPLLLVTLAAGRRWRAHFYVPLTALLTVAVLCLRVAQADAAPLRPAIAEVERARAIAATMPGQVWLPWNPLVTYFAEGRFYHAEDGLYVRFITGHPVSVRQARAHLPPHFHAMAFPSPQMQWGVAAKLAPASAREQRIGRWEILTWPSP